MSAMALEPRIRHIRFTEQEYRNGFLTIVILSAVCAGWPKKSPVLNGAGMGAPQVGHQLIMHVHPCMFLFSSIKKH